MAVKNSFTNLVVCLGAVTLVCGSILAGVYVLTQEPIAQAAAAKQQNAIAAVLPPFSTLSSVEASGDVPSHFVAYDEDGGVVGYVVTSSSVGFGGPLSMMVGFRPDGSIFNTSVLGHSETPGLGAKCTDEPFASQFRGFNPAVKTLKVKKDGGDVDAITASTITSRAYCAALENAVSLVRPIIEASVCADKVPADTVSVQIDTLNIDGGQSNE